MTKKTDTSKTSKMWLPQVWWVPIIAALITVAGLIIMETIKKVPSPQPPTSTPLQKRQPLEKISFDYWDSPDMHGWEILDQPPLMYKHITDGFVGESLEISSYEGHAIDYRVNSPAAGFGNIIEYVIKPDHKTMVYTKIKVLSENNTTTKDIWLAFVPGAEKPKRIYDGDEWTVYITPQQLGGGWLLYQVDLKEVAKETIETDGWNLEKIIAFRLRGNLSIASITIYK